MSDLLPNLMEEITLSKINVRIVQVDTLYTVMIARVPKFVKSASSGAWKNNREEAILILVEVEACLDEFEAMVDCIKDMQFARDKVDKILDYAKKKITELSDLRESIIKVIKVSDDAVIENDGSL